MSDEILKKFGRYFLLDRIAQGGMAEIYRARLASPEGAGRILVIKRIQAGFNSNDDFLAMFKSEIKVTMGFNHPNIVQLYDFGDEQGMPYIAMEYVDGKNAKQFSQRFEKNGHKFPIELSAYIIEQSAAGLQYAHTYRDKITGQPLNVVHRDISPQNILVSFDGNVKVIDFGIAKATTNSEATQAGVIKGKPSYLAPEQISGLEVDGRCDLFALGICLWELLVGRKLFVAPGENEYAVLKLIESCQTFVKPPSTFNPQVPKELDAVVMKALQKKREDRFQTAEEFQRALKKFLVVYSPEFSPSDLTQWSKSLFKDQIVEDRKELQRLNGRAEQLLLLELEDDGPTLENEKDVDFVPRKEVRTFDLSEIANEGQTVPATKKTPAAGPLPKPGKVPLDKSSVKRPAFPSATDPSFKNRTPASGTLPNILVPRQVTSTNTRIPPRRRVRDAEGRGSYVTVAGLAVALVAGALFFTSPGKRILARVGLGVTDRNPASSVVTAPEIPSDTHKQVHSKEVSLKINVVPNADGARVVLNDHAIDPRTLVAKINADAPLELVIEKKNFKPFRREFVVQSSQLGELKEWAVDVNLEPLYYGFVTLRTEPSSDVIFYPYDPSTRTVANDGKPWATLHTPIINQKFPVGTYRIQLENKILGMGKTIQMKVLEHESVLMDERLELLTK